MGSMFLWTQKGLSTIGEEVRLLAQMAKENSSLQSLNWLGPFGIKQFCAVVYPPQAAILAVGSAEKRVVRGNGPDQFNFASYMPGISPGHTRDTDASEKALVQSIMLDANGETNVVAEYEWSDDEDDEEVNKMREEGKTELVGRKMVKTKTSSSSHGQEGVDIDLLASLVSENLKEDFHLLHGAISTIQESANAFTETILENISGVFWTVQDSVHQIASLSADIRKLAVTVHVSPPDMANNRPNVVDADTQTVPDVPTIISDAINFANRSTQSAAAGGQNASNANTTVGGVTDNSGQPGFEADHSAPQCSQQEHVILFPPPDCFKQCRILILLCCFQTQLSLGLTQEARLERLNHANVTINTDHKGVDEDHEEAYMEEAPPACRKSKRHKVPTKSLLGEYECDKGFLNRARKEVTDAIYRGGNIDYSTKFAALMDKMTTPFEISTERGNIRSTQLYDVVDTATQLSPQVVDVLMFHISALFWSQSSSKKIPICVFMDTQFVSQFTKLYTKFSKVSRKDSFKFTADVVDMFLQLSSYADAVRFYFPFFVDKKYWVAICVDCSS
ncbi:hypothetical protein Bca52824_081641 [Brassica carinata]|uniref:Ubiquitin-like protease family profile domain-containing protein n=1 Tax=Brassica carinata TaxID=52824 RepID=A0A8X7TR67_BRACI|nr:hypothetical protein Bca52824_081641 [Brassica carinata]